MLEPEQRKFRADPLKLKRLRVAAGLTAREVRDLSGLDRTTVTKILAGEPVFLKSLSILGARVFRVDNPLELLHPDELQAMGIEVSERAQTIRIICGELNRISSHLLWLGTYVLDLAASRPFSTASTTGRRFSTSSTPSPAPA